ncbi:MAG: integrase arm-type DNA-binding domain-containing protein, partial [Pseudomonadota bacterium]|nr:integrase arm-type DNA-binding domain-containing protein [Pseudomonadota bacterium]
MLGQVTRRGSNKLSPRRVATITVPGRLSDGGGLYLVVDPSGAKRWAFIFRWKLPGQVGAGKLREMGLGSALAVTLAKARERATEARALVAERIDPIASKRADRAVPTFGMMADEVLATRSVDLRSEKSKARWKRALETHAVLLRPLAVDAIATEHVLASLKPIWAEKPETAQKTRGYIEAVLDAAKAKGHRTGENPARWKGHLDHLLPRGQKLSRGHHAALAFCDVPSFVAELRERDAVSAWALEFLILTVARTGEVTGATWPEVDLAAKVWTIPAGRMKAGIEHRVALSDRAVE